MKLRGSLQWLIGVSLLLVLFFCARQGPELTTSETSPWRNIHDSVGYVGMATCRSCHQDIHTNFVQTGMGRSLGKASASRTDAQFGDHALVYDTTNNLYYFPYLEDSLLYIREFRLSPAGDTIYERIEEVAYIIGSGHHTNSHLVDHNGYIYQAPITYYTQEQKWDLAPGFEDGNERFSRLLTAECLTCHNDYPKLVEGSLNRYTHMPEGIACERCHGAGELHAREKLAGIVIDTAQGPDYSIVNPKRLSRDLQMDLCQRCHLQGIAVLEPGKDFYDFRPGMQLQEVFNVYLPRFTNSHEKFIMASQADRLRMSKCYLESEMTCITCHNPHHSVRTVDNDVFNAKCQSCHQTNTSVCSADQDQLATVDNDCVYCHMPPSGSTDIPHINITDHNISRANIRQGVNTSEVSSGEFLGLDILTKPQASHLDMARAYLALYDKYAAESYILDSVAWHLQQLSIENILVAQASIHYWFNRENYRSIANWANDRMPNTCDDAWTAYRIGQAFNYTQRPEKAIAWQKQAVALLPQHIDFMESLATAYLQASKWQEAQTTLLQVISEHPKRPQAYLNLGYLAAREGKAARAIAYYDQALALEPDYIQALLNKSILIAGQGDPTGAQQLIDRVLILAPNNQEAIRLKRQFM